VGPVCTGILAGWAGALAGCAGGLAGWVGASAGLAGAAAGWAVVVMQWKRNTSRTEREKITACLVMFVMLFCVSGGACAWEIFKCKSGA
jgi:hypothetical protein